jgi:hypothetical protein
MEGTARGAWLLALRGKHLYQPVLDSVAALPLDLVLYQAQWCAILPVIAVD